MNKITFLLLFIPSVLCAQITITDSEMPQAAETFYYSSSTDFLSVDVNSTGANQNWDYSSIGYLNQDSVNIVSVSSTSLAYQVNFNIPFTAYQADYAVEGANLDAFGQITITDRFDFYKVKSSALQVVGFGANVNGIPMSVKYDTIDQIYPLSMTYGTTDSTSASYLVSIPSLGTYGQWIRRKVEVDGWGSITTPYANYANTIRVKTTLYQKDTLFVDQFGIGTNFDRPVETIYEWYETTQGVPVFKAIERSGALTEMKYLDVLHVSITEEATEQISYYPNPVKNSLHVAINEPYSYQLSNLEGKVLKNAQSESSELDFSDVPAGVYLLKLTTENGVKNIKIIKE